MRKKVFLKEHLLKKERQKETLALSLKVQEIKFTLKEKIWSRT